MSDDVKGDDLDCIELVSIAADERAELMQLVTDQQAERMQQTQARVALGIKGVLMKSQIKWQTDLSDVRIWEKSRRIGCTWGCAAEAVLEASRANRGMSQYYMGYNLGMAAEFIGDCAMWCRAFGIAIDAIQISRERHFVKNEKRDITLYRIRFSNGRVIEALSSNPLNWRGRQGHARIDEAGHIVGLRALVDAAMAWLLWGGRVSITGTHNGEGSEFNALILEVKAGMRDPGADGTLNYSYHYTDFDQALAEGFYQRVCVRTQREYSAEAELEFRKAAFKRYIDKDRANEELLCIPRKSSGEYMPRVLLEHAALSGVPVHKWIQEDSFVREMARIKKAEEWFTTNLEPVLNTLDKKQRTAVGEDFARDGDATGLNIAQEVEAGVWHPKLYFELRNIPFDVQVYIVVRLLRSLPRLKRAKLDARGNGQSLAEACVQDPKIGHVVDAVMVSAEFYSEHFPRYRAALSTRHFRIVNSPDVIEDHRLIQLVNSEPRIVKKRTTSMEDGHKRHGDSMVAHFMCYLASVDSFQPPAGGQVEPSADTYKTQRPGTEQREPMIQRHTSAGTGLRSRVRGWLSKTF